MANIREVFNRILSFFNKRQRDSDLDAELQSHIDLAVEENIGHGMSPEEARRRALIRFGGVQQAKEQQRDARGLPSLDILMQDLRYTLRTLGRNRIFTIVAVLILALGIGANIAVFSVVNTLLLRPLPLRDPERLVLIAPADNTYGLSGATYSADAYDDLLAQNHSYVDVTGYYAFSTPDNSKLTAQGEPKPLTNLSVAGNFFHVLGVDPALGRSFTAEESIKGGPAVVMLSYPLWQRQFNGDRSIIGRSITLDGVPVTVVGLLPETFDFGAVFAPGAKVDLFSPVIMDDIRMQGNTLALIGRLKPEVTLAQAQSEADLLFPTLHFSVKHPEYGGGYTGALFGLKDYVTGKLRRSLIVLWCAVGLILLIVCVNLSNLLLARGAARTKEFAMRTALGATCGRLLRQLLTESLILSFAGGLLGLGIAFAVTIYLAHQGSIALPLLSSVHIDVASLAWTLAVAVTAAVLFGLVPGLRIAGGNLQESLKDSGHGASDGKKHDGLRSVLIISEIALACVLLVGAGLLLRSFLRILDVDLGFAPSRAASISLDYNDGGDPAKRSVFWQEVLRRVEEIPGVETAGITDNLPMSRNRSWGISVKGKDYRKGELEGTFVYIVSPGYLNAIGMHLVKGRDIRWDDTDKKVGVVIINETIARRLWPGDDPIGRIASVIGMDARVIGVVADVRESSVEGKPGWQMYLSGASPQFGPDGAQLVVRTKLPPQTLAPIVMRTIRQINPGQPATEFRPVQGLVDHVVSPRRFFVILIGVFAGLGLILASLGIYGVISYSVMQRTQEIGIRMALGASQGRVQLAVIGKTLLLALIGIFAGHGASFAISSLIASLLFGTRANDQATFLSMILLLLLVALLAGYIPARRAARINPMIALRNN